MMFVRALTAAAAERANLGELRDCAGASLSAFDREVCIEVLRSTDLDAD